MFAPDVTLLGASIDPDAARWIATVGQANVSQPRGRLISDTICELKAANVWAALDFLPVLAAENAASALVDWKARKTMTATNSPAFTADRGYEFNGTTNYINTAFLPGTDATAATGTSQMIGVYERTNVGVNGQAMGALTSTSRVTLINPRREFNAPTALINSSVTIGTSTTDSRGLGVAQSDNATVAFYKNGAANGTATPVTPGSVLVNEALFIGGHNTGGALQAPRACSVGYALFGGNAWTATQHQTFYDIMQRYMVRLGANV